MSSTSPAGYSCCTAIRIESSFLPALPSGSCLRADSSAWRTHSAKDMCRDRATRCISLYSGSWRMTCSRLAMSLVYLTHGDESILLLLRDFEVTDGDWYLEDGEKRDGHSRSRTGSA